MIGARANWRNPSRIGALACDALLISASDLAQAGLPVPLKPNSKTDEDDADEDEDDA